MPKPRKTKAEKAAEATAHRICTRALSESGKQINILDIPQMYRVVYDVLIAGPDHEARAREAADAFIASLGDTGLSAVSRALKVKATERAAEPMQCGACAAVGTNAAKPTRHAPGCVNDAPVDLAPTTVHYRTHMIERDGTEFTSPVGFEAPETGNKTAAAHIAQACVAGHLKGTYYWCTEEGTGRFLNGIGPDGNWITCSRVSTAPAYISGRLTPVYIPAVRIYNPHPRLTYRRIRGSAETLVAYDTRDASLGPEPMGWVLGEDVPAGAVVS